MAKRRIENYVFKPGMSYTGNINPNAYSLIELNKDYIIAEAIAYINQQIAAGTSPFNGYTYNTAKCERDIGYILSAYLNDLRYGGNQLTSKYISRYWENAVSQLDGSRQPEVVVHTYIKTLIKNYILANTAFTSLQFAKTQTIDVTKSVTNATFTPTAATYDPQTGFMTITIGSHTLAVGEELHIAEGAITFTCAKDGHATTHPYPRGSGVPNVTGKDPYWEAPIKITSVTDTTVTIFVGISSDTSAHLFSSAVSNGVKYGPTNKIEVLANRVVDVIDNGLTKLPSYVANYYGYLKIQGKYDLNELLLITNSTKNEIIFNFTSSTTGATREIIDAATIDQSIDNDFVKYLQTTDGVTILKLNADTSLHSSTDDVQIFIEEKEIRTRPYDFGTDAIERMRVAPALSMLDADFEYGLQPTKWSAIGMMRGYPSVYEVPGSELNVLSVITDASAGTNGVGQSLITVTTVGNHGFETGDAITIKALENSISGAARAEGAFVIIEVPTNNTFTFYAKAKVGTSNGDVLSTTYTQLRAANFYTGSSISVSPTFAIASNGFSGAMVAELNVADGSTRVPYDGQTPEIGAPLVHDGGNISAGTQVTQAITNSAGGGLYLTKTILGDSPAGTNVLTVDDSAGILTDLAFDRGDGTATFVSSLDGNNVSFTGNFSRPIIGQTTTYTGITGDNYTGIGVGALFNISISGGIYTVDAIVDGGASYVTGDRILITGSDVGGITPTNDLVLVVNSTFSDGAVDGVTVSGTAFTGITTITGLTPAVNGGIGVNAVFDISYANNAYTSVTPSNNISESYEVNDIVKIPGNFIPGGENEVNDAFVTVTSVDSIGSILSASVSGVAPNGVVNYNNITSANYTYSGSTGAGAVVNITRSGTIYSATVITQGTNYLPTETLIIDGSLLGGVSTTNDCTITIDNVDGAGAILAVSVSGTSVNSGIQSSATGSNLVGSGAEFTIDIAGGSYAATVTQAGIDYGVNQTFTIDGSTLAGTSITNDLTITINTVDGTTRGILTETASGTATTGTGSFTNITGSIQIPEGTGVSFNVLRSNQTYTPSTNTIGLGYRVGDKIDISGQQLGGETPLNDLRITVSTVDGSGGITGLTSSYEEAVFGDVLDFITTITLSEPTTGGILKGEGITYTALATIGVTFEAAHGIVPGDTFIITIETDDGLNNHSLAAGSFIATDIPTINSITYQARAAGNIDVSGTSIGGTVLPRPDSFFIHRPYDGGVQLGTGGPQHGSQAIRQSKNYIRYQSGKGIMYTTGALFAPSYDLRSVTANGVEVGSTITIVTDDNDHGVQVGGVIRLIGVETEGYNSGSETYIPPVFDYTVTNVVDERTFEVQAQRRLGNTTAVLGFAAQMSVVSWHGATVRSGIFDDQNGIFWEYDGTQLSVVQRTGTKQVAGTIAIKVDKNLITGTNTRFRDQLKAGDRIIIKGMTHVISHISSQTSMTVTPDYRGVVDVTAAKAMLITDKKTKQRDFNLDRLDGTGPSGYNADIAKMQMIGIQYSWYGAGFIDFMLRGSDGNFVFAHRMRNSNVNTEAFMRSGNLPVRYEVTNEGPSSKLSADIDDTQTTLNLDDSSFYPSNGTVYIDNEIIRFTGNDKLSNRLTGLTRGSTLTNFQAGATRSYGAGPAASHTAKTGVILISQSITPLISHWGSAFITDGGFDEDRGYIFSYTEPNLEVSTTKQTAFLIRLAPSVSNAIIGDLGERELLNRAQLLLQGIEVTSDTGTGGIVIEGVLNPKNYPINPANVGWQTLSTEAQGGQPSFAQVAAGGSVVWSTGVAATTATLTHENAILGTAIANDNTNDRTDYLYMRYDGGNGTSDINLQVGDEVVTNVTSGQNYTTGLTVTYIQGPYLYLGNQEVRVGLSNRPNINTQTSDVVRFRRGGTLSKTNKILATAASFNASGAAVGTAVTATSAGTIPPNTLISSIEQNTFAGTTYYEVLFNNSYNGSLTAGSGTVEVTFSQPPFAQPGETVFSFIANPGERSQLMLDKLKELTNTTLGGRGTFPNGPDVLAINVYKVSGAALNSNIILRWGEAQA